nr:BrnT family toxin [Acidiphilium sp. PM]
MQDEFFQWDDAKASSNWRDHGVTFEMAREVFKDPFALEWIDDTQGVQEPRYSIIGLAENRMLFVAYTMRGEVIRIISARKAEPYERRRYHDDND